MGSMKVVCEACECWDDEWQKEIKEFTVKRKK